ncbi:hypothetical protein N9L48_02725, partial [Psychrosphaera sp.]|nr:hypothetical protein [Psychrosphaera sp.]
MRRLKIALEKHSKYTAVSISALFLLSFLLGYLFLSKTQSYQNNVENAESGFVLFESLLLKPSFHLYSTKDELSHYSDFHHVLKKDWDLLWGQWSTLKSISDDDLNARIEKRLTTLELNHWLYISYTNNQLPARHTYLLQEKIIPISNEIFNLSSLLINELKLNDNHELLAHAADFRGFFTYSSKHLTANATSNTPTTWDNYQESINAASNALRKIKTSPKLNKNLISRLES